MKWGKENKKEKHQVYECKASALLKTSWPLSLMQRPERSKSTHVDEGSQSQSRVQGG